MLPLTKEKVELMALAAELNQAVYYQGNTNCDADTDPEGPDCDAFNPGYEALGYNALYSAEIESGELTVFISDDKVDANLFMDIGDYCFVTWRATINWDFTDMTSVLSKIGSIVILTWMIEMLRPLVKLPPAAFMRGSTKPTKEAKAQGPIWKMISSGLSRVVWTESQTSSLFLPVTAKEQGLP